MGDEAKTANVPFQGAGQDPNAAGTAGEPGKGDGGGERFTRTELEQLLTEREQNLRKEIISEAQSLVDKSSNRQQKRVDEYVKTLEAGFKSAGIEVPAGFDVRAEALKQVQLQDLTTSTEPSGAPATPAPVLPVVTTGLEQPPGAPKADNPSVWAYQREQELGVAIEKEDPEAKLIKADGSVDEYKSSYVAALKAKIARVGPSEVNPSRSPGSAPGGMTNTSILTERMDPDGLLEEGFAEAGVK